MGMVVSRNSKENAYTFRVSVTLISVTVTVTDVWRCIGMMHHRTQVQLVAHLAE